MVHGFSGREKREEQRSTRVIEITVIPRPFELLSIKWTLRNGGKQENRIGFVDEPVLTRKERCRRTECLLINDTSSINDHDRLMAGNCEIIGASSHSTLTLMSFQKYLLFRHRLLCSSEFYRIAVVLEFLLAFLQTLRHKVFDYW